MSEEINNREYRQKVLQSLITQLHAGKSVDEVKGQFAQAFDGVSAAESAIDSRDRGPIRGCDRGSKPFYANWSRERRLFDPTRSSLRPRFSLRFPRV